MMVLSEQFPCQQESCRRVSVTVPRAAPALRRSVSWACVPRMRDSARPPPVSTQVNLSWYLIRPIHKTCKVTLSTRFTWYLWFIWGSCRIKLLLFRFDTVSCVLWSWCHDCLFQSGKNVRKQCSHGVTKCVIRQQWRHAENYRIESLDKYAGLWRQSWRRLFEPISKQLCHDAFGHVTSV